MRKLLGTMAVLCFTAGLLVAQGPPVADIGDHTPGDPPNMPIGGVVIDFDDLFSGEIVTTQYPEATFSSSAGSDNKATPGDFGTSLPNFICTGPVGGSINCVEPTFIDFTSSVSNLTLMGVGIDDTGVVAQVNVFVGGTLDSTVDVIGQGNPLTPVGVDLSSFSDVTRIELVNITDGAGIGWDDVSFDGGAPVSTMPVALSLTLIVSLLTIGGYLVKQRLE